MPIVNAVIIAAKTLWRGMATAEIMAVPGEMIPFAAGSARAPVRAALMAAATARAAGMFAAVSTWTALTAMALLPLLLRWLSLWAVGPGKRGETTAGRENRHNQCKRGLFHHSFLIKRLPGTTCY